MSSDFTWEIRGGPELLEFLKSLPEKDAKKAIRKGVRAGGRIILKAAKRNAPKGPTGNLRRYIRMKPFTRPDSIGASIQPGTREEMNIAADARWYYPAIVEYGSKKRNIRPRRYMWNAVTQNSRQATNVTIENIRQTIETARAARH